MNTPPASPSTPPVLIDENSKFLLRDAVAEIKRLRQENEILKAKVETMELLGRMFYSTPGDPQPMCPDLLWSIERRLAEDDLNRYHKEQLAQKADEPDPGPGHR